MFVQTSLAEKLYESGVYDWNVELDKVSSLFPSVSTGRSLLVNLPRSGIDIVARWLVVERQFASAKADIEAQVLALLPDGKKVIEKMDEWAWRDASILTTRFHTGGHSKEAFEISFWKVLFPLYLGLSLDGDVVSVAGEMLMRTVLSVLLGREALERVLNTPGGQIYDAAGDLLSEQVDQLLSYFEEHEEEVRNASLSLRVKGGLQNLGVDLLGKTLDFQCFDEESIFHLDEFQKESLYYVWGSLMLSAALPQAEENKLMKDMLESMWS